MRLAKFSSYHQNYLQDVLGNRGEEKGTRPATTDERCEMIDTPGYDEEIILPSTASSPYLR